jgi:glycerol 2-dehydrogenase (NADP+)
MASSKYAKTTFTLENGAVIPAIGFGTWKSKPEDAYESVKTALQAGYRHIDTAFVSASCKLYRGF